MNKYLIGSVIGILLVVGIFYSGDQHGRNAMKVKIAAANKKYQDLKNSQQEKVNEITQKFTDNLDAVTRQRDAAIKRLRSRSDRMSESTKANCKGTTGAELSGKDAEFLVRESSRADRLREALTACYHYADTLQR